MYGEGQRGRTGVGARSAEVPEAGQQGDTEVWNRVKRRLRAELGEDVFTSWFARLELDAVNDGCAHLTVPTRFLKSWIEAHYADRVRSVYRSESPLVANIAVAVRSSAAKEPPAAARPHLHPARADTGPNDHARVKLVSDRDLGPTPARSQGPDTTELGGAPLDPRLSFTSFIVGRSNALAHAAADRVARHQGAQALYNPLYLHAGVGLGKTHLLHAIGHEARRNGRRVIYLTADRFMYGFVAALKAQTALAFKERLRGIDLLIIDDVQFIQGKLDPAGVRPHAQLADRFRPADRRRLRPAADRAREPRRAGALAARRRSRGRDRRPRRGSCAPRSSPPGSSTAEDDPCRASTSARP